MYCCMAGYFAELADFTSNYPLIDSMPIRHFGDIVTFSRPASRIMVSTWLFEKRCSRAVPNLSKASFRMMKNDKLWYVLSGSLLAKVFRPIFFNRPCITKRTLPFGCNFSTSAILFATIALFNAFFRVPVPNSANICDEKIAGFISLLLASS